MPVSSKCKGITVEWQDDSEIIMWIDCTNNTKWTFVCPCIANVVVNDDQQDVTNFGLFIYS